jgi:PTS system N-acetylglucosamine-specific IIC component
MALTSFLTGVTEPIEFTFMFLAPLLYALHAVLTGVAMVVMHVLDVRLGFSFSAGLFDYVLNFDRASRPWMLLPVGIVYFALYYGAFRFFIRVFDLKTPGRETEDAVAAARPAIPAGDRGGAFVTALGGAANLVSVDACTTRLRLVVADNAAVDEAALKQLGARGIVRPTANAVQVVLGPVADQVAGDIRAAMQAVARSPAAAPEVGLLTRLLDALGGLANLRAVEAMGGRLLATVASDAEVDEAALTTLSLRGIARPSKGSVHLLLGSASGEASLGLSRLLNA